MGAVKFREPRFVLYLLATAQRQSFMYLSLGVTHLHAVQAQIPAQFRVWVRKLGCRALVSAFCSDHEALGNTSAKTHTKISAIGHGREDFEERLKPGKLFVKIYSRLPKSRQDCCFLSNSFLSPMQAVR